MMNRSKHNIHNVWAHMQNALHGNKDDRKSINHMVVYNTLKHMHLAMVSKHIKVT